MSEEIKPIKSFEDKSWKDFIEKCKKQVDTDNSDRLYDDGTKNFVEKFNATATFLDYSKICCNPKYILVGIEPSSPQDGAETSPRDGVETVSFPLFLHYCAWKYLCGEKFDYYITDFAKGAMPTAAANDKDSQKARYPKWLPLFEQEWKLLGQPEIILMGKYFYGYRDEDNNKLRLGYRKDGKLERTLSSCDIRNGNFIYHYTTDRTTALKAEYDYISKKFGNLDGYKFKETELTNFKDELKKHLNGKYKVCDRYYDNLLNESLKKTHWKDKVFPLYSYYFKLLSEKSHKDEFKDKFGKNIIPHKPSEA
ncbi:MAG: hypothetical protein FWC15_08970 [Fibromonadales bacterium]|nr:hypothetical protein [Fibromonadales bacterium]